MYPIIFSLGPFTLYTFNIFLIIGVLGAMFLFWQRTHTEHFEDDEVFDVLIISTVMSLLLSRVISMVFSIKTLAMNPTEWLSLIFRPGFDELAAVIVGLWYVWFLSNKRKWDAFELTDFASTALSFLFVFIWVGRFFAGTFLGNVTTLPIGVTFPNVFDSRHPSQLYFAFAFLFIYIVLLWVEKRYRFFRWYRAGRHTANSGFVLSLFLTFYGLVHLALVPFTVDQIVVFGVRLDLFFYIVMILFGLALLFLRSGSNSLNKKKWAKVSAPTTKPVGESRMKLWMKK